MDEKLKALDAAQDALLSEIDSTQPLDRLRAVQYKQLTEILLEKQKIYKHQLELLKNQIK